MPKLGFLQVGGLKSSSLYVNLKKKAADLIGIEYEGQVLPEDASQKQVEEYVRFLNEKTDVNGILLQLPLPKHLNATKILDLISPTKDVDGIHPINIGSKSGVTLQCWECKTGSLCLQHARLSAV